MCTRVYHRIETYNGKVKILKDYDENLLKQQKEITRFDRIPCGQCLECRLNKAKEWAFRCVKEAKYHKNNIMITLTYDDEHIPTAESINEETGEIETNYTLKYEDYQKFMKKLKKKLEPKFKKPRKKDFETFEEFKTADEEYKELVKKHSIRFYCCGEYGSDKEYIDTKGNTRKGTKRPHFHAILFNCEFPDMKPWRMSVTEWSKEKNMLYRSEILDKLWKKGHAELNEVNFETCRYVAGYITKKYKGELAKKNYYKKNIVPPDTWMSRRPGIAKLFYEDNKEKFFKEMPLYAVTKKGLKKVKSRYFDKQMEKDDEEKYLEIKEKRKQAQQESWENLEKELDIDRVTYINNQESKVETKNRLLKKRS